MISFRKRIYVFGVVENQLDQVESGSALEITVQGAELVVQDTRNHVVH